MEFKLDRDIRLVCVKAKTFPEGIRDAFSKLETLVSYPATDFYGVSYLQDGKIIYKAAVEEAGADKGRFEDSEIFILKNGTYITEMVHDFMSEPSKVKDCFERLMALPEFDNQFPCVEWYHSPHDVKCMVRKKD